MRAEAIVFTSNTGYTAAYAELLKEKTGLPAYSLSEAKKILPKQTKIIYLGWLMAGKIEGYSKAKRRYAVAAVCGVGLGETGSQLDTVKNANRLEADMPLFTLQGGMDLSRLHGIKKFMIQMLTKGLSAKSGRTADEEAMLELIQKGGDYVSEENLAAVWMWYQKQH